MVFLFPFWEHLAYCGSTFLFSVLHGSQSKCLPQLTAGKGLWEPPPFYSAFPPPQLENMRQILFMYAVTSK